jgi:FkbM family methyltransferase
MKFLSHAQNFEDVLLWRALGDVENGRYLDIGAQDPVVDSVSLAFYEAGWRGIHVEPTSAYAEKLRAARPDELVIQAAVSDVAGPIEFYEIPDTGLSTGKIEIAERHSTAGFQRRAILVPTIRLQDVLERQQDDFHWMKVDVEGMEPDVLRSWGDSEKRPWVLVIEATCPLSQDASHEAWTTEVFKRGYNEVHFDGLSRYFVHDTQVSREEAFKSPPNVFDLFAITRRHFSAAALRGELEHQEQEASDLRTLTADLKAELTEAQQLNDEASARIADTRSALFDAIQQRDALSEQQLVATNALAKAEQEHRLTVERMSDAASALKVEVATFAERTTQLQERLAGSERERERSRKESEQRAQDVAITLKHRDQLLDELAKARSIIFRADVVIRNVQRSMPGRWRHIGEALGFVQPSSAFRELKEWSPQSSVISDAQTHQFSKSETSQQVNSVTSITTGNPYLRANSLPELLLWHDIDFVRCAYVTVLGRQPDPAGEAFYTQRLRGGVSKMTILRELRFSQEAKCHDPGIAGFDKALKRHRNANRPVVGTLLRSLGGYESDRPTARRARSLEYAIERLERTLARQQQHDATAQALLDIQDRVHWIADQLWQVTDDVASIKSSIGHQPNGGKPQSPVERFDPSVLATDDLDLSSRARSIVWALQSAKY